MTETVTEGKVKVFTRDNLPAEGEFAEYRKTEATLAMPVAGTMRVVTREGVVEVTNGWLAIDVNGWPYPIADDVFRQTYEPVAAVQAEVVVPEPIFMDEVNPED